ncbi:MAG: RnfH family protein [Proteobacteria bacterium]|nr:RnfH family protein [Pseudomonadota bacterium]
MQVEVVFATRERQWLKQLSVPKGSSAIDAVRLSGLDVQYAQIMGNDAEPGLGVFGQSVAPDHLLAKGDRVELYRPLKADFKDVRRELAKKGKVMGRASQ